MLERTWDRIVKNKRMIVIAFIGFMAIVATLFFNWKYFDKAMSENEEANCQQQVILSIGKNMQEVSDSLTYNVRNYVLTNDIEYLKRYWNLIEEGASREQIIRELDGYDVQPAERRYLQAAQAECLKLHEIELCAMRLAFTAYDVRSENFSRDEKLQGYIEYVETYDLTDYDLIQNRLQAKKKAIQSLIDTEYIAGKDRLNSDVANFVIATQERLEAVTRQTMQISRSAIAFQAICILLAIVSIILFLMQNSKVYSLRHINKMIVSAVSDEYLMIYMANLKNYKMMKLRNNPGEWDSSFETLDFLKINELYAEKCVKASYRDSYLRIVQPQNIQKKLDKGQSVISYAYKKTSDEWVILDITKSKEYSKENPLVILTFKNAGEIIQQQNEQRQRDEMLMYFSREYFEVYVVDLIKGSYEIIRSAERYGDYIKNLTGDFVQLMEMAIVSWTKPPYRDMFKQLMDMEDIKKQFEAGNKKIEFIYESYDEKWKRLQCFPVPDFGIGNEKMIFALRDYSEEMQIRTNEVLASVALTNMYMFVASRDIEANKYECIHCSEDLFDIPEKGSYEELVGMFQEILHEEDREKFMNELSDERYDRDGMAECEYRLWDRKGKLHYYHEYITKVNIPSGSRMVILIKNIDESKKHEVWKAEQMQKELRAKAKELEMTKLLAKKSEALEIALKQAKSANEAKSRFLSNMSHDLRTPMNAILGMAYLAKKRIRDEEQLNKCVDVIMASSENMLALINDVLDMSKIESGVIELHEKPGNIARLIHDLENIFKNRCEDSHQKLTIIYDRVRHLDVIMDEVRVKQILTNLLSNAAKYTQPYGTISLEVIEDHWDTSSNCSMRFVVTDDGIGMSEEFVEKIYKPFEREESIVSDKVEGTGLGMAIVKSLVDTMKGNIEIVSKVDIGTKVTVTIPLQVSEKTKNIGEKEMTTAQHKYSGKHVLVVEDKRINLEIVKGFLEDTELVIEEARNGEEAVRKMQQSKEGSIDLIFMDIRMPVMKGDEATIAIRNMEREDCKKIPIIAMTANALESDVENSYRCGMNGHISKPIEPEEVYKCLNKWLLPTQEVV